MKLEAKMQLNHLDKKNNPTMVDISEKLITNRVAKASSIIYLPDIIAQKINAAGEINLKKGPVFQTAIIAATLAIKSTHTLIPFCHPLLIQSAKIDIQFKEKNYVEILCEVKVNGNTGVEMEALTGATIAALTIYDMCKALSHEIKILETKLIAKRGGKRIIENGLEL